MLEAGAPARGGAAGGKIEQRSVGEGLDMEIAVAIARAILTAAGGALEGSERIGGCITGVDPRLQAAGVEALRRPGDALEPVQDGARGPAPEADVAAEQEAEMIAVRLDPAGERRRIGIAVDDDVPGEGREWVAGRNGEGDRGEAKAAVALAAGDAAGERGRD